MLICTVRKCSLLKGRQLRKVIDNIGGEFLLLKTGGFSLVCLRIVLHLIINYKEKYPYLIRHLYYVNVFDILIYIKMTALQEKFSFLAYFIFKLLIITFQQDFNSITWTVV